MPECCCENGTLLVRMIHRDATGRKFVNEHRLEQLGTSGRERMRWLCAQKFFKLGCRRERHAVFNDESAEAATITFLAQRTGQQREMDVAPGFVPSPERAGGDVVADAFLGATLEREFPIVDCPRAVRGEVRDPAALDQDVHHGEQTVLHEMRAVEKHHVGAAFACGFDVGSAGANVREVFGGANGRGSGGINEHLLNRAQATPLCERVGFYLC